MKRILSLVTIVSIAFSTSLGFAQFEPGNAQTPLERARWLAGEDALPQARRALLDAIDDSPEDVALHFELGLVELELGNPEAASFAFSSAAEAFSSRFDLVFNEAVALADSEQFAEAAALLATLVEESSLPEDLLPSALGMLGGAAYDSGDFGTAVAAFQQLYETTDAAHARFRELQARFANGERDPLVVPLRSLRAEVGHEVSLLLARLYQDIDLLEYAERELLDARRRASSEADFEALSRITYELGMLFYEQERYEDVVEYVSQLEGARRSWESAYLLASAHLSLGKPGDAMTALRPYREEEVETASLYVAAAFMAGNLDEVTEIGDQLVLDAPFIPDYPALAPALVSTALAYVDLGRSHEALSLATELSSAALPAAERVALGDVFYSLGAYREALQNYEEGLDASYAWEDAHAHALVGRANAWLALGEYEQAARAYREVIGTSSYDTEAHHFYGWALLASQDFEGAKEAWQVAAERGFAPSAEALKRF